MTHHEHPDDGLPAWQAVELLAEHGFEGLAQALTILLNEAMKLQRAEALGAAHDQRTTSARANAAATPTATSPRPSAADSAGSN